MFNRVLSLAILAGLLLSTAGVASSATNSYFNNSGGSWATSAYWNNGVPTASVNAGIGSPTTATANLNSGTASADNLYLGTAVSGEGAPSAYAGAGVLDMNGTASLSAAAGVYDGYYSTGTLDISGGTLTSVGTNRVGWTGITGTVAVDGSGSSWTMTGQSNLYVGYATTGSGTLNITNGGAITVDGTGSNGNAYIGNSYIYAGLGTAALNFGSGGAGYVGGTFTTRSLYASPSQMTGTGTINCNGLVTDAAVAFTTTTSPVLSMTDSNGGTVTVNLNMSVPTVNGPLGVGYGGAGSLNISGAQVVTSNAGYLGFKPGSNGTATISGSGSEWNSGPAFVGEYGTGTLNVNNGGTFNAGNSNFYIADASGQLAATASIGTVNLDGAGTTATAGQMIVGYTGTGTVNITNGATLTTSGSYDNVGDLLHTSGIVNVNGPGSTWNDAYLMLGNNSYSVSNVGAGTVKISNGGTINTSHTGWVYGPLSVASIDGANSVWNMNGSNIAYPYGGFILSGGGSLYVSGGGALNVPTAIVDVYDSASLLEVDVGRGSSVASGVGLTNNGTVRVVCAAAPTGGNTYTPITVDNSPWAGSGTVQAVGGTWASGTFTASTPITGSSGTNPTTISDLSVNQRMLITDSASKTSLGASFLAAASSGSTVTLTAETLSQASLTPPTLSPGQSVLSGWALSESGSAASTNPAYLSLSTAFTYPSTIDQLWSSSYNGSSWSSWTQITPNDLTFDNTKFWASFGTTNAGLNNYAYAVTGNAVIAGDANLDGRVDINDLTIVLTNYGMTGQAWTQGSMDGDPAGTVDINDLTIVLANYNTVVAGGIGIGAVPEPANLLLLGAGLASLLAYARRRRQ
jgi:T5SS/PEP-CTERM-associated repeat protein